MTDTTGAGGEGTPEAGATRGGPPRWMLLTGCGCLVPGFLLVSAGAYFLQQMGGMMNQGKAWEGLEALIEFDPALRGTPTGVPDNPKTPIDESFEPAEFVMRMGGTMPISEGRHEFYYLGRDVATPMEEPFVIGPNPLQVTIAKLPSDESEKATEAPRNTPVHEDGSVTVHGYALRKRTIPNLRTPARRIPFLFEVPERSGAGAAVWLRQDFTDGDDDERTFDLVAFFQRPDSLEPIRDDEIQGFLEGFEIPDPNAVPEPSDSSTEEVESAPAARDGLLERPR
ncbi:MAG: hypothetical protein AAFU73_13225 [Planctomycetota bacterium]